MTQRIHSISTSRLRGTPIVFAIFSRVQISGLTKPLSILLSVPRLKPPSKYVLSWENPLDLRSREMLAPSFFKNSCCFGSTPTHRDRVRMSCSSHGKGFLRKVKFRKGLPIRNSNGQILESMRPHGGDSYACEQ